MLKTKTATITLNAKDYKWSDGQPFTIDDYIFAIEAIGKKDYTGSPLQRPLYKHRGDERFQRR